MKALLRIAYLFFQDVQWSLGLFVLRRLDSVTPGDFCYAAVDISAAQRWIIRPIQSSQSGEGLPALRWDNLITGAELTVIETYA